MKSKLSDTAANQKEEKGKGNRLRTKRKRKAKGIDDGSFYILDEWVYNIFFLFSNSLILSFCHSITSTEYLENPPSPP